MAVAMNPQSPIIIDVRKGKDGAKILYGIIAMYNRLIKEVSTHMYLVYNHIC